MANCKLVTYDLDKPGQNYNAVISAIKNYKWAKVCESAWIVQTEDSCVTVRDHIQQSMDTNDRIFVTGLSGEAAWNNVICSSDWLKENL